MKVKCIKTTLTENEVRLLGDSYNASQEYHITKGKEYVAFGLTISFGSMGNCIFIEHTSDFGHLISTPIYLFDIIDARNSKYWEIKKFDDGDIALWPPSFYKNYYHDDLSEGVTEVVSDFKNMKIKIEQEFN